jgi:hypothetical protein
MPARNAHHLRRYAVLIRRSSNLMRERTLVGRAERRYPPVHALARPGIIRPPPTMAAAASQPEGSEQPQRVAMINEAGVSC